MKLRSIFSLVGILLIVVVALVYTGRAQEPQNLSSYQSSSRSDMILIDGLESLGSLERPAVIFLHDLHTDAVEKQNKDCTACHLLVKEDPNLPKPERLSLKFKRLDDSDKQEVMNLYHSECMSCHKEMSDTAEKTGPVEACGECHIEDHELLSSRQSMELDKSLHFRHTEKIKDIESGEGDCKICHHEYNEKTKNLFYAKGKEGSCLYCHKTLTEENRISIKEASHLACIDCHRKNIANQKAASSDKNQVFGPTKCNGCHDSEQQQKIKKAEDIPRIKRDQPDTVLIQANLSEIDTKDPILRMSPVPFDHMAHEKYNDTCITCHHTSLDSCAKTCHTLQGATDGKDVQLEQAMHHLDSDKSCLGCHEKNQEDINCAGCHAPIQSTRMKGDAFCQACHMTPLPEASETKQKPEAIAARLLQSRTPVTEIYHDDDIPEIKIIGELSDQYKFVEFPHQKILNKLVDNIKDNKLATYFHTEKETICQACHHNSPASQKPPGCTTCHGKPFDKMNPTRPGLKAAYHQLCLGCHKEMQIEKPSPTGCTECHKEVGLPRL